VACVTLRDTIVVAVEAGGGIGVSAGSGLVGLSAAVLAIVIRVTVREQLDSRWSVGPG
jgi:hypothetical protein